MIGHSGLLSVQGTYLPSFLNFFFNFTCKSKFLFSFLNFPQSTDSRISWNPAGLYTGDWGCKSLFSFLSLFIYFQFMFNLNEINIRLITIFFIVTYHKPLTFAGGCNRYGGRSLILLMENSANPGKTRTRQLLPCFPKHSLTKTQHFSLFIYSLFLYKIKCNRYGNKLFSF